MSNVIHVISRIQPDPVSPNNWAYTGLSNFCSCPRRWYLAHCNFDKFSGPLPPRLSKAGVEGNLLHSILEEYYDRGRDTMEVFRPRQRLLAMIEEWYQDNRGNFRVDTWHLKNQLSIVEVVRKFYKAIEHCGVADQIYHSCGGNGGHKGMPTGVELWFRDPHSKLIGRCDLVKDGVLVDFKSGEPHAWHRDQVLYYACLLFCQHGYMVKRAELLYLDTSQRVNIDIPAPAEMERILDSYRQLANAADNFITQQTFKSIPVDGECQKCPGKMLCSEYGRSIAINRIFDESQPNGLFDCFLSDGIAQSEATGCTVKVSSDVGKFSVFLSTPLVSEIGFENLSKIGISNVALHSRTEEQVHLKLTSASEVFLVTGID